MGEASLDRISGKWHVKDCENELKLRYELELDKLFLINKWALNLSKSI
jgi:hypothetical protein